MLRVDLGRVRQQVGQQAVWKVFRPAHRLCHAGLVLDQAVDDLLGWDDHWRGRQLRIEHVFDSTPVVSEWQQSVPSR
jgi:hypothetical protein